MKIIFINLGRKKMMPINYRKKLCSNEVISYSGLVWKIITASVFSLIILGSSFLYAQDREFKVGAYSRVC